MWRGRRKCAGCSAGQALHRREQCLSGLDQHKKKGARRLRTDATATRLCHSPRWGMGAAAASAPPSLAHLLGGGPTPFRTHCRVGGAAGGATRSSCSGAA